MIDPPTLLTQWNIAFPATMDGSRIIEYGAVGDISNGSTHLTHFN